MQKFSTSPFSGKQQKHTPSFVQANHFLENSLQVHRAPSSCKVSLSLFNLTLSKVQVKVRVNQQYDKDRTNYSHQYSRTNNDNSNNNNNKNNAGNNDQVHGTSIDKQPKSDSNVKLLTSSSLLGERT